LKDHPLSGSTTSHPGTDSSSSSASATLELLRTKPNTNGGKKTSVSTNLSSSYGGGNNRFLKDELLARVRRFATSTGHARDGAVPPTDYDEEDYDDRKTGSLSLVSSRSSAASSVLSVSSRRRSRTSSIGEDSRLSPAILEAILKQQQEEAAAHAASLNIALKNVVGPTAASLGSLPSDFVGTPASAATLSETQSLVSVEEYNDDDDAGYTRISSSEYNAWTDAARSAISIYAFASKNRGSPSKGARRRKPLPPTAQVMRRILDSDSSDDSIDPDSDSDDLLHDLRLSSSDSDFSDEEPLSQPGSRSTKNVADTAVMPSFIQKQKDQDPSSGKILVSTAFSTLTKSSAAQPNQLKQSGGHGKNKKLVKSSSATSNRSTGGLFEMEMDSSLQAGNATSSTAAPLASVGDATDLQVADVSVPNVAAATPTLLSASASVVTRPEFADINIVYENPQLLQQSLAEQDASIASATGQITSQDLGLARLEFFPLKIIYQPGKTGFEPTNDFPIKMNDIIAGRYQVIQYLGSAAFSRAVQCLDHKSGEHVCVKIIKNNKDYFDQSLDEIKLLHFIQDKGDCDENNVLRMLDFFYFKEHLFIVCELLRENLYEVYKYNRQSQKELYFTIPRLQKVAKQCLIALKYIHGLNLMHCDLKPENILIKSYSRCLIKVIDFGSSCFTSDQLSSYVQSRSYRAPEVVLGHQYDQRIDMWSLGCILAELWTGKVLFQNDSVPTLLAKHIGVVGVSQKDCDWIRAAPLCDDFFTPAGVLYEKKGNIVEYIYPKRTSLKRRVVCDDTQFLDFLRVLLKVNPAERVTSVEALNHPWFKCDYIE
jgi:hypothetical protein